MRRSLGMTLLEIMMVVAILALLAVAMIVYLLPSDDRRVRMEAERMAAYLQSAGAEAVMRDGPVRVAFDFGEQTYDREVARVGADIRALPFEDDPAADRNRMRQPVRLAEVLLPAMGDVTSGTAWMLWKGRDTEGGVAVLELNEAVWSVVVDPNTGEVRAERGRATLPVRGPGLGRSPFALGMPGIGGGGGGDLTAEGVLEGLGQAIAEAAPAGVGSGGDAPRRGDDDGDDPAGDPEQAPDDEAGGPGGGPGAGPGGGPEELPEDPPSFDMGGAEASDAGVEPDAGPKCTRDEECAQLEVCDANKGECVYDPRRQEYRLAEAALMTEGAPEAVQKFLNGALSQAVRGNRLNLIVKVEGLAGSGPPEQQPLHAWVVQGQFVNAAGDLESYDVHPHLPSLFAMGTLTGPPCASNGEHCYVLQATDGNQTDKLRMWIHADLDGPCKFQQFTLVASIRLELSNDPAGRHPTGMMVVEGMLRKKDAERFKVKFDDKDTDLAKLFETAGYAPDRDMNNDGEDDAWALKFGGKAVSVRLRGHPGGSLGATPPGCSSGN